MEWIILGVIVLLTVINVPIGYALSIATILAILWTGAASLSVVPLIFSPAPRASRCSRFRSSSSPAASWRPRGISQRLVNLANSLVGFIRGGLAMVTVGRHHDPERDLGLVGGGRRGHRQGGDPGDGEARLPARAVARRSSPTPPRRPS